MSKEDVLNHVEDVIRIARLEIKKKKSCKSDQMRQITGLVNAYTRLLIQSEFLDEIDQSKNGDPDYYDLMVGES